MDFKTDLSISSHKSSEVVGNIEVINELGHKEMQSAMIGATN